MSPVSMWVRNRCLLVCECPTLGAASKAGLLALDITCSRKKCRRVCLLRLGTPIAGWHETAVASTSDVDSREKRRETTHARDNEGHSEQGPGSGPDALWRPSRPSLLK